jgi:hypothetical protein
MKHSTLPVSEKEKERLRSSGPLRLKRLSRRYGWLKFAIVLAIVVPLAWVPLPVISTERDFFQNLDRNLLTGVVLAAAALSWFNLKTVRRATRKLLRSARVTPEKLFPHSPGSESAKNIFGRDQLVEEIVAGLDCAGPQIVVGGTGSGKTTLLLALASRLARDSTLPVVLSLRDRGSDLREHDFSELAFRRFSDLIDGYVESEAEVEKVWRQLSKRRGIVVLADDLDRSADVNDEDSYRTQIRLALDAARRRHLPLVLTTRPSGLPPNLGEMPINLADFRLDGTAREATESVMDRAGRDDEELRGRVEKNIEQGELLENPFYLTLLAGLVRSGTLGSPADGDGKHGVRLALLHADRARLAGLDKLSGADRQRRVDMLRQVEDLAAWWLVPRSEPGFGPRWTSAIRGGERLGLLAIDDHRHPKFKHEVLHAYYASRAILRGAPWKRQLEERPNGARVQLTLIMTAAQAERDQFCREACQQLMREKSNLNADQCLLRAAGAAELARAGSFSGSNRLVADGSLRFKGDAGSLAKRAILVQLEALAGPRPIEVLWEYAHDDDYNTRWAAVEALVRRCSADPAAHAPGFCVGIHAYEAIEPGIESALADAREILFPATPAPPAGVDDWGEEIVLLKQLAWMLPSLRGGADAPALRGKIKAHLTELLRLEREGAIRQRGLEASIAQGFKAEARRYPAKPPDQYVAEMLRTHAVFWYSQLNLVHALALRMATDPAYGPDSLRTILEEVQRREQARKIGWSNGHSITGDLHPMVRYAGKLCQRALAGRDPDKRLERMKRVVWKDEGMVVGRRPAKLGSAAAQLVGDLTVLLNLNETGRDDQRLEFGEATSLPHCLRHSLRRQEFRKGCHRNCSFGLCPVQPALDRPSAHRELSRAFCRDQRLSANMRTAWGWGSRVTPRALPEFWRWLEGQARF